MSHKFHVGQQVVCVDPSMQDGLKLGATHKLAWVSSSGALVKLEGFPSGFRASRFEPALLDVLKEAAKAKPRARWYIIRSGASVIKSNLHSRDAAIEYLTVNGSPGTKYIIAKETGEFEVSRTVTEV